MSVQTVMWTALPNGIVGNPPNRRLRISVVVSPRLKADGEEGVLSSFSDFLNWPSRVQPGKATFAIQVGNSPAIEARVVHATPDDKPDEKLWSALFSPSTLVRSHRFDDLSGRPYSSSPVTALHRSLKKGYQNVIAASPVHFPDHAMLDMAFPIRQAFRTASPTLEADDGTPQSRRRRLSRELFRTNGDQSFDARVATLISMANEIARADPHAFTEVVENDGTDESLFAQLIVFHRNAARGDALPPPRMDFHQAVAALAEYPELLKRLGLVIDLELDEAGFPQSSSAEPTPRTLRVVPTLSAPFVSVSHTPSTAYLLEGGLVFRPAPSPGTGSVNSSLGFLDIRRPGLFELLQVDVDGAGLKSINMTAGQSSPASPERNAVPALRTTGISLAWTERARATHDALVSFATRCPLLEAGQDTVFFHEDLTRGYRIDVRDSRSGQWHSLHQRRVTYRFTAHPDGPVQLEIDDEGTSQPSITHRPESTESGSVLSVHESLMHWQNWSLAATRPGKAIAGTDLEVVSNNAPSDGFPLNVTSAPQKGSLPRLRFGVEYQFRARIVDLAGKSLTITEADALLDGISPLLGQVPVLPKDPKDFIYRRFEPVPAPTLVPRERYSEGESLERLVIRSNHNQSAAAYATQLTATVDFAAIYRGSNDRHVVPPKASLWMAEAHGLLDEAFGHGPDESDEAFHARCVQVYRMARKEKGGLGDTAIIDTATGLPVPIPPTTTTDPQTGATVSIPSVELVSTNPPAPGTTAPIEDTYALHHEAQLMLPYLPDPLAHGAALFGLPGVPVGHAVQLDASQNLTSAQQSVLPDDVIRDLRSTTHITFAAGNAWPDFQPFRMQIVEPSDAQASVSWDRASRVLTVPLAKAENVTVRLSSSLASTEDIELLGLWQWLLERNATEGLPAPSVRLVQTALAGAFWMLTPYRDIHLVHAVQQPLVEPSIVNLRQCLSQEVDAIIEEQHFEGAVPAEVRESDLGRTCARLAGEILIHGKSTIKIDLEAHWHETIDLLSEAKSRVVYVKAIVAEIPVQLPEDRSVDVEVSASLLTLFPGTRYIPGADKVQFGLLRHEFGDTKHRTVRYRAIGTTRFREYFPPVIAQDGNAISRTGPEVEIEIASTARPAPPQVVQVLPTFSHSVSVLGQPAGSQIRTRARSGVRVYLKRPWFSSGDGELLAVILPRDGNPSDHPSVTQWGRDPIWGSADIAPALRPDNFPRATTTSFEATLAEDDGATQVVAVGHVVAYDEARQLWYCDIEIDAGPSYFPFVRLALARFQPVSILHAAISRVVNTNVVQIAPERTVHVQGTPGNPDRFTIRLEGLTYQSNAWHPGLPNGQTEVTTFVPAGTMEVNPGQPRVHVRLQERIPGSVDEAGWMDSRFPGFEVTQAVVAGTRVPPGTPLWIGTVSLPGGRKPGQFRVVIKEFEHLLDDNVDFVDIPQPPSPDPPDPPDPGPPPPEFIREHFYPGRGRLVFADAIEL